MITPTRHRVEFRTDETIRGEIAEQTRINVEAAAAEGDDAIDLRLIELDHEWDVERALELNFAVLVALSVTGGMIARRRWPLILAAVASGFMVQHALHGWCPPLPLFRQLGFRTAQEINRERVALKAMRGDFDQLRDDAGRALRAAE